MSEQAPPSYEELPPSYEEATRDDVKNSIYELKKKIQKEISLFEESMNVAVKQQSFSDERKGLSAYSLWVLDYRRKVKQDNPNVSFRVMAKLLPSMWKDMRNNNTKEYQMYVEMSKADQ